MLYLKIKLLFIGIVLNVIILEFAQSLEKKNTRKGIYVIVSLLMFMVLGVLVESEYSLYWILPIYSIIVFLFGCFRKNVTIKKVFINTVIIMLTLSITMIGVNMIIDSLYNRFNYLLECIIIYFFAYKTVVKMRSSNIRLLKAKDCIISAFSMILSGAIIVLLTLYPSRMNTWIIICIIVMDFTLLYMILQINEKSIEEKKYLELEKQYQCQNQYMEDIKQLDANIQKTRHDMKSHFNVINDLLINKNYDKAKNYIEEYTGKNFSQKSIVKTDNDIANAVVNSKIWYCNKNDIPIFTAVDKNIKKIDDIDICSLLGNVLDNAIEASEKLIPKDRYIELSITRENNDMIINIQNRIGESVLSNNKNLKTSKKDVKHHGLGTKIISDIVKKYDGYVDFYEQNNMFCCKIKI